jgi:hypothetical protein
VRAAGQRRSAERPRAPVVALPPPAAVHNHGNNYNVSPGGFVFNGNKTFSGSNSFIGERTSSVTAAPAPVAHLALEKAVAESMESSASSAVPAVAVDSTSVVHQSEDGMDIDVHEESKDDHAPILAIILSRSTASARGRRTGEKQPSAPVPTTAVAI